jgi:hypothetical protein
MTDPVPAFTASWNGQRYSSCKVRSSMFEDTDSTVSLSAFLVGLRLVSCSLRMKCLRAISISLQYCYSTDLCACDNPIALNASHRLVRQSTAEVGIVGEAFPVTTVLRHTAERPYNWPQSNVDALSLEFASEVHCPLVGKVLVPTVRVSLHLSAVGFQF